VAAADIVIAPVLVIVCNRHLVFNNHHHNKAVTAEEDITTTLVEVAVMTNHHRVMTTVVAEDLFLVTLTKDVVRATIAAEEQSKRNRKTRKGEESNLRSNFRTWCWSILVKFVVGFYYSYLLVMSEWCV
jgi:hypothetical protein